MEYFVISAKFVPLKYYTLSSQLRRLTSFSVGCSGRRILSPGQIAVMRKWSIECFESPKRAAAPLTATTNNRQRSNNCQYRVDIGIIVFWNFVLRVKLLILNYWDSICVFSLTK